jgi:hypothetical protein
MTARLYDGVLQQLSVLHCIWLTVALLAKLAGLPQQSFLCRSCATASQYPPAAAC